MCATQVRRVWLQYAIKFIVKRKTPAIAGVVRSAGSHRVDLRVLGKITEYTIDLTEKFAGTIFPES
jgi:hypothetical protein